MSKVHHDTEVICGDFVEVASQFPSAEDAYGGQNMCLEPHPPSFTCPFNFELSLLIESFDPNSEIVS